MMIITCDACRRHIAEHDAGAARNLLLGGERADWCGECVQIVRTELPRIVAQARAARLAAAPVRMTVQERARSLWPAAPTDAKATMRKA